MSIKEPKESTVDIAQEFSQNNNSFDGWRHPGSKEDIDRDELYSYQQQRAIVHKM